MIKSVTFPWKHRPVWSQSGMVHRELTTSHLKDEDGPCVYGIVLHPKRDGIERWVIPKKNWRKWSCFFGVVSKKLTMGFLSRLDFSNSSRRAFFLGSKLGRIPPLMRGVRCVASFIFLAFWDCRSRTSRRWRRRRKTRPSLSEIR